MKFINFFLILGVFAFTSCATAPHLNFIPEISARICQPNVGCGTVYNLSYNGKTYGITNAHVCHDYRDKIVFDKYSNQKKQNVKVIHIFEDKDICIVDRIAHLPNLELSKKKQKVGTLTFIQGYPLFKYNFSMGKIVESEYMNERGRGPGSHVGEIIFTTNYVNYGNSGSPVLDVDGRVLGTVSMKTMRNDGIYIPYTEFIHYYAR